MDPVEGSKPRASRSSRVTIGTTIEEHIGPAVSREKCQNLRPRFSQDSYILKPLLFVFFRPRLSFYIALVATRSHRVVMDGDTGDHDNLFHIGGSGEEDEREGGQEGTIKREELQAKHSVVKALPEAFSTQEEGMGNDPYNLDDWDVLNTGERDNE